MNNQQMTIAIRSNYRNYRKDLITHGEWSAFLQTIPNKEMIKEALAPIFAAQDRLKRFCNGAFFTNKIRSYCNFYGYSDVHAYEVVKVVSDKTVHVRRLDAKLVSKMQFEVGGFSAICTNNGNQKYEFSSNEDNGIVVLRLGKNGWGKGKFRMSDAPHEHYDYNF